MLSQQVKGTAAAQKGSTSDTGCHNRGSGVELTSPGSFGAIRRGPEPGHGLTLPLGSHISTFDRERTLLDGRPGHDSIVFVPGSGEKSTPQPSAVDLATWSSW